MTIIWTVGLLIWYLEHHEHHKQHKNEENKSTKNATNNKIKLNKIDNYKKTIMASIENNKTPNFDDGWWWWVSAQALPRSLCSPRPQPERPRPPRPQPIGATYWSPNVKGKSLEVTRKMEFNPQSEALKWLDWIGLPKWSLKIKRDGSVVEQFYAIVIEARAS